MSAFNNLKNFPFIGAKGNSLAGFRQSTFLLGLALLVSACGAGDKYAEGVSIPEEKFTGIVIADDARAALVGKEVLDAGGNAFDAAVATALTMAVTVPSRAGFGSGGECQFFNPATGEHQVLTSFDENTDEEYAVPALPRAMLALHAKGGRWRWNQVVAPAEYVAKTGFNANRPYILDIYDVEEGEVIEPFDLALTLASLRSNATQSIYAGNGLELFAEAAARNNTKVTLERIRQFAPKWMDADVTRSGISRMYFTPESVSGVNMVNAFEDRQRQDNNMGKPLTASAKSAGMAVVDSSGTAVTCVFSMGKDFDKKREIPGTGIVLAKTQKLPRKDMATMMMVKDAIGVFNYVGYMTSINAPNDLLMIADDMMDDNLSIKDILTQRAEDSTTGFGAIYCKNGLPYNAGSCRFIYNPTAGGYGSSVW